MSVDQLIAQADPICARYRDREAPLRAAIRRDDSPEAYRRIGELLPQLAALLREQTDVLEQLDVPAATLQHRRRRGVQFAAGPGSR
jgi:hypothetical protein